MNRDLDDLCRRLESLARSAERLRAHAPDLHDLGWESPVIGTEKVAGGQTDMAPRTGLPQARRLYRRLSEETSKAQAELVGLERAMMALFFAGSSNPEPSRGSLISRAEFERQLTRQRRRAGTPVRLVDQPQHPGAHR